MKTQRELDLIYLGGLETVLEVRVDALPSGNIKDLVKGFLKETKDAIKDLTTYTATLNIDGSTPLTLVETDTRLNLIETIAKYVNDGNVTNIKIVNNHTEMEESFHHFAQGLLSKHLSRGFVTKMRNRFYEDKETRIDEIIIEFHENNKTKFFHRVFPDSKYDFDGIEDEY